MRSVTSFICQQCGYNSPQWMGKCPECNTWNSLVETVEQKLANKNLASRRSGQKSEASKPQKLSEIKNKVEERISTGFLELDRVLGGGMVGGSATLLAGDPGVGKSTLLLEVGINLNKKFKVLYVSGEESAQQIKMRALRLRSGLQPEASAERQVSSNLYFLAQTLVENIISEIKELNPDFVIVDSIQTIESEELTSSAGSIGQVRECASYLIRAAKEKGFSLFLVGHVTKEGNIAGPMVLSHMVDAVLFLEGERFKTLRILRSFKNRFGPVDEVGVFSISQSGINEVKNPSEFFLGNNSIKGIVGSVVVASIEGTRPILVEIQSLVVSSKLVFPKRVTSGVDLKRVELLCAVLQKQCSLPLDRFDVFVNVAGGLVLREPGIDLAICLAIFSSLKGKAFPKTVAAAEVGLLGELRRVSDLEKRIKEAKKLGFTTILTADKYRDLNSVLKHYAV